VKRGGNPFQLERKVGKEDYQTVYERRYRKEEDTTRRRIPAPGRGEKLVGSGCPVKSRKEQSTGGRNGILIPFCTPSDVGREHWKEEKNPVLQGGVMTGKGRVTWGA